MNHPLSGVTVVVTRPSHQSRPLVESLQREGAEVIALPVLAIEPIALDGEARERLAPDRFDWAIFTSANAVEQAVLQLQRPQRCRIAAVGRATARALEGHGMPVHAMPAGNSSSEGLLALAELAELRSKKVLIVRGAGGRELLGNELARRGADVTLAELYRRGPAPVEAAAVDRVVRALHGANTVVVLVTSVEGLEALLGRIPPGERLAILGVPWLVPGERVARAAREHGLAGPLFVARSAEDDAMVEALRRSLGHPGNPPDG